MLNLTILSLASSTLFSHSPSFVGNRMEFNKGYLNRLASLIFYNQQNLLLTKSIFERALHGIVLNDVNDQYQHDVIPNINYIGNEVLTIEPNPKRSVSIIECTFKDINSNYAIHINSDNVSLYITQCLFSNCTSKESGVVNIGQCRCLTISHVCSSKSNLKEKTGGAFLFSKCFENDFSIVLYNSVVDSNGLSENSRALMPHSGNQYFRCNNVTGCNIGGFQFDAVQCFSFAMNTIVDCDICLHFSGNIETEKIIENCNLISENHIFILSGQFDTLIKDNDCVLVSTKNEFINRYGDNKLSISFIGCLMLSSLNDNEVSCINCTKKNKDEITYKVIPHFTYKNVCLDKEHQYENAAYGCNAGNCIDNNCNSTIGFPDDVVPYTTFIYGDIQSKTFLPTKKFTPSNAFSETNKFSESIKFTKSSDFLSSLMFSKSK